MREKKWVLSVMSSTSTLSAKNIYLITSNPINMAILSNDLGPSLVHSTNVSSHITLTFRVAGEKTGTQLVRTKKDLIKKNHSEGKSDHNSTKIKVKKTTHEGPYLFRRA